MFGIFRGSEVFFCPVEGCVVLNTAVLHFLVSTFARDFVGKCRVSHALCVSAKASQLRKNLVKTQETSDHGRGQKNDDLLQQSLGLFGARSVLESVGESVTEMGASERRSVQQVSRGCSQNGLGHSFDTPGTLSGHFLDAPEPGEAPGDTSAIKHRGRENRILPQDPSPKRAKMVLCPFHRRHRHREICTRNRPVSETKFLDDFWGPLSLRPLCFTAGGTPPDPHSGTPIFEDALLDTPGGSSEVKG